MFLDLLDVKQKNLELNHNTLPEIESDREDDFDLRNLPTSVYDLQTKEFHRKLERNFSSPPLISRNQTPICIDFLGNSTTNSSSQIPTRCQSVSSNPPIIEELDADDLEVCFIFTNNFLCNFQALFLYIK